MIYPYIPIETPDGKRYYFPLVNIELIFPLRGSFLTKALVDSGADRSLFDIEILEGRGIDIKNQPPIRCRAAAGLVFDAWEFPIEARFQGRKFQLQTKFCYMRKPNSREPKGFNLLGREDFFRVFRVEFNQRKKNMDIRPYK